MPSDTLPAADDASSVLRVLGQENASIELTKTFRGLVLQQDVRVLEVNPDAAAFRITNLEMSAALEGIVYLRHARFPKPVKARFKSLDIRKGDLILSGFAYSDNELKKRQDERVRPKRPTYVTVHWNSKAQRACMENISDHGMGILAFKFFEKGMRIRPGSKIRVEFHLPPGKQRMTLNGTIIYVNPIGAYLTTIGMRLYPTVQESRLIHNYIAPRKQDILEELNQAFWELIQPRGIESLYF